MFVQPKELNGRKPLIQIRAGRMDMEGKLVTPDLKKGVFTLVHDASGMLEILWTNMNPPNETTSTVVFPGEATFDRVEKVKDGRVFVLDFKGSRQQFWWLQESSEDRDEEFLKLVKKHLKDGKTSNRGGATASTANTTPGLDMNTLQGILSGLGGQPGAAGTTTGSAAAAPAAAGPAANLFGVGPQVDIQDLLASQEVLDALNEDPAFYMTQVHQHLPEGTDPSSDVVDALRNPQVSATGALLQAAVSEADGFREVTSAFGLGSAAGIGSTAFLKAIEDEAEKKKKEAEGDEKPKEDK